MTTNNQFPVAQALPPAFLFEQLVFSTADIEGGLFHDAQVPSGLPPAAEQLLVVHGRYFRLLPNGSPEGSVPFTPGSALLLPSE